MEGYNNKDKTFVSDSNTNSKTVAIEDKVK